MKIAENVLTEFEEKTIERNKFYYLAITLSCIFICFAASDLIIDFESFTLKQFYFDWFNLIMLILFPAIGLILTIKKAKTGWFISTLFFSFFSALSILAIVKAIVENDSMNRGLIITSRQLIIMTITILPSILFQTKNLRVKFQINRLAWISTITISICLAVALITFA